MLLFVLMIWYLKILALAPSVLQPLYVHEPGRPEVCTAGGWRTVSVPLAYIDSRF